MRNQKAKGLKVKQSIEIFLFIAIIASLLYRVRHYRYKKTASEEMNMKGPNKVLQHHRKTLRRKGLLRGWQTSPANDDRDGNEQIAATDEEQEPKGPQDDPIDADGRGSEEGDTESTDEKHNGVVILVHGAVDSSTGEAYNSITVNEDIDDDDVYGANVTENETMLIESMPEGPSDQMQQQRNSTTITRMDIQSSLTTETGSKYQTDKQNSTLATISLENEASDKGSSQYQDAIEEMGSDDDEEDMLVEETAKANATAGVEIEERITTLSINNDTTAATSGESDVSTLADGVSQNSSESSEEEAVDL